jgi:hypothetical protein
MKVGGKNMSKHSEYKGNEDLNEELEKQLLAIRKKDRIKLVALGIVVGLMVAAGAGIYISELNANSAYAEQYSNNQLSLAKWNVSGAASGSNTAASGLFGAGGSGGGCGSGGSGGGGCGAGGGALGSASLSDLEKQGLEQYKQEKGAADVTAKAANLGCHIQIDISDKSGTVVRSYGFQGGPLYVIK